MGAKTNQTEHNDALIFIPDISGFTNFVNNTEILHARHIISELLESIIDSNEIELKVSEIEGDAVLFYRFGKLPSISEILAQVQKMYTNFKANLKVYESQRICQCGACTSAQSLSLKFVVHYGEVVLDKIKDHQKLFGSDVIVAHRLLKNNLSDKQYLLVTDQLLNVGNAHEELEEKAWSDPIEGESEYDFGTCKYYHLPLNLLDSLVPEPTLQDYALKEATMKIDEFEGVIQAPIKMVFDVVSDLAFRHIWMEALKDSDMLNSKITKNGASHRCVIKDDNSDPFFYSHSFEKQENIIRFTESDQQLGLSNVFVFEAVGEKITRLSIHSFIKPNIIKKWLFNLMLKKKHRKINADNYKNLNSYCNRLIKEGREHEASIIL